MTFNDALHFAFGLCTRIGTSNVLNRSAVTRISKLPSFSASNENLPLLSDCASATTESSFRICTFAFATIPFAGSTMTRKHAIRAS